MLRAALLGGMLVISSFGSNHAACQKPIFFYKKVGRQVIENLDDNKAQ